MNMRKWLAAGLGVAILSVTVAGVAMANDRLPGFKSDTPASNTDPTPTPTAPSQGGNGDQMEYKDAPAPIDEVDVAVLESYPPQYLLIVKSGLPNGCAKFKDITHSRDGDTVTVTVTNLVPADDSTICTMIYGTSENSVNLGSDFESGKTYNVVVNGETTTFTAQ